MEPPGQAILQREPRVFQRGPHQLGMALQQVLLALLREVVLLQTELGPQQLEQMLLQAERL